MPTLIRCPICGPRGTLGFLRLEGPMRQVVDYRPPWWEGEPLPRFVPVGTVDCYGCNGTGFAVKED